MIQHPEQFLSLTSETFVDLSKHTLKLIQCEWEGCPATLNSWSSLHQHTGKHHCQLRNKSGIYECRIPRCTARSHSSARDLQKHIDANHMTRCPLPCPIKGCDETFIRPNYIPVHFLNAHADLENCQLSSHSPFLKKTWHPLWPGADRQLPQPLPNIEIGPIRLLAPTVFPAPPKAKKHSSSTMPLSRKWSHLSIPDDKRKDKGKAQDSDGEAESEPFEDLPQTTIPAEYDDPDFQPMEFIIRPRPKYPPRILLSMHPPLTNSALDRPQDTPTSVGYDAFQARYNELEKIGLIQGTGVWPVQRGLRHMTTGLAGGERVGMGNGTADQSAPTDRTGSEPENMGGLVSQEQEGSPRRQGRIRTLLKIPTDRGMT